MPPAKKPKPAAKKTPRCSYKEGSLRCVKNATTLIGDSAFCGTHARTMLNASQRGQAPIGVSAVVQQVGDLAGEVLSDILGGKPLNREKIATAINDFAWGIGGAYASYQPPVQDVPINDPTGQQRPRGRGIFDGIREAVGGDWSRPRVDPEEQARRAAVARARVVLGFGPAEVITADALKARHRELSKKHHPDRGGKVERMQEINAAVDTISATL